MGRVVTKGMMQFVVSLDEFIVVGSWQYLREV
jgi:hypothetical protein